jgi:hypothetical protein
VFKNYRERLHEIFIMRIFVIFILVTNYFILFEELFAQNQPDYLIDFRKEIPQDKAAMMISRINAFGEILQSNDHSMLKSLWNNSFDQIKFDGNFSVTYSNLDYLNSDPNLPRKYGKGDVSIILSHWAGQVYEKEHGGFNISQNYVVLCFLNEKKIGSYYEFGRIVNESFGVLFSEHSGLAEKFQFSLNTSENMYTEWDQNGKITSGENIAIISKMRNLPSAQKTNEKMTQWGNVPIMPTIKKDKELQIFFKRMIQIMSAQHLKEIIDLLELPLVKSRNHKSCHLSFCEWRCQWGYIIGDTSNDFLKGYAFAKTKNGLPDLYLEGQIYFPETFLAQPTLANNGIEVKFHSTGYPATYKTIVKNRLYGRQIEWNDKGELISDVDLDIPKEWKDAPKKNESQTK